jgi:hypothetical protein
MDGYQLNEIFEISRQVHHHWEVHPLRYCSMDILLGFSERKFFFNLSVICLELKDTSSLKVLAASTPNRQQKLWCGILPDII